jgi:ribosomal protein S18 acetylase RimI-like enzyme
MLRDAVAAAGLSLRPQTADDTAFLRRLYISLRWDELGAVAWEEPAKIAFLEQQFDFQSRHYAEAYRDDADFDIVERGGDGIGRLYVHRSPSDLRIVDIGFLPQWRNRGLGTALILALQREAAAAGRIVSIHVEQFNPAQRLYERLGFRRIAEKGPYWLMEWRDAETAPPDLS